MPDPAISGTGADRATIRAEALSLDARRQQAELCSDICIIG